MKKLGVGKTIIAALGFSMFREKYPQARLLIIVHGKGIWEQSIQKFREILNDFNFGDLYVEGNIPTQVDQLSMNIQSIVSNDFSKKIIEESMILS